MSNYSFPKNCFFCKKHYSSSNCLLPYDVVINFTPPTSTEERIMEITLLHTSFDTNHLHYAASVSIYRSSRSDSIATHSQSATGPTSEVIPETPIETQSTIGRSPSPKVLDLPQPLPSTQSTAESSPNKEKFTTVLKTKTKKAKSTSTVNTVDNYIISCDNFVSTPTAQLHVIGDFTIAVTTAVNLRRTKKNDITLSQFMESMHTELEARDKYGKGYKPHRSTSLNHPIALAREMISYHLLDKPSSFWLSKNTFVKDSFDGCLLHHPFFINSMENQSSDLPLHNCLLAYARTMMKQHPLCSYNTNQFHHLTKTTFDDRKCPTTSNWVLETSAENLFLKDERFYTESSKSETPTTPLLVPAGHTCPPMNTPTQRVISDHLDNLIQDGLTEYAQLPFEPGSKTCHGILSALITEILAHSPHWESKSHNTTASLIKTAAMYSGFAPKPSELTPLMLLTENILSKLRDQIKAYK